MVSKIIKQGGARASGVQPFHFAEQDPGGRPSRSMAPAPVSAGNAAGGDAESPGGVPPLDEYADRNELLNPEDALMNACGKRVEPIMKRYAESILEIDGLRSSLYAQIEREVVKLALEVAKIVVRREIQADREMVQTLVRAALSRLSEASPVTIHLNPIDYDYLLERRAELCRIGGREVSLEADPSIERGGCLIRTEDGDIDARIEEKFRQLQQALFEGTKLLDRRR